MVFLDGERLTVEQVEAVAGAPKRWGLSPEAMEKMLRSRAVVERLAAGDAPVYGVNTGVGCWRTCASRPTNSSSCSATWSARTLAEWATRWRGRSSRHDADPRQRAGEGLLGIRPVVAERLCDLLNRGVTPVVPSRGSVGASGDLAPLAHMALVLIGEGEAEFEGERLPGGEALRRAGWSRSRCLEGRHFAGERHPGDAGHRLPGAVCAECWRTPPMWFAP